MMEYNGRILFVAINLLMIVLVKLYGLFQYEISLSKPPYFGFIFLLISYFLGRRYDLVKFLSEKDSLTKIYNRRYVISSFPKLCLLADKNSEKLLFYLIDVDQFKNINDSYGHEMGDKVLKELANILLANTKKTDIVSRWAGDEFLVIVTSNDDARKNIILHQVNKELKRHFKFLHIGVSVSIGFSEYPKCSRTLDELIHIADLNMYKMKPQKYL